VRVRVGAAAVNFPDVLLIANRYQVSVPAPFVPGSEYAGVVIETGSDTDGLGVGDRVSGAGMVGAFAQEVIVPAAGLSRIPDGVDDRTAAAFGVAYRTAYHTLRSVIDIQAGQELVVLGAGGGVGLATVQLGVQLGASVTAVASSAEKLDVAAGYGATHTVNHTAGDLRGALKETLPNGAHAVVDPVGGQLSEPALRSLRRLGRFVTVGFASGDIPRIPLNLVLMKGISIIGFQFQDVPADDFARNEAELRDHLASGRVRPHVGAVYPLSETVQALKEVAEGRAVGKVLIDLT
jgi:NADPH2:quinone reductase